MPVTAEQIDQWHAARGFARDPALIGYNQPTLKHIGYHYVIYRNGPVVVGRGWDEAGAHVAGHNAHSLGICLIGTDKFSRAQWKSLRILIISTIGKLAKRANLPNAPRFMPESAAEAMQLAEQLKLRICGHRDLSPDQNGDGVIQPREWTKTCPGFSVADWLANGCEPPPAHVLDPPPAPLPRAA